MPLYKVVYKVLYTTETQWFGTYLNFIFNIGILEIKNQCSEVKKKKKYFGVIYFKLT